VRRSAGRRRGVMSPDVWGAEISRRQFLKRAGASGALLLVPELAWIRGPTLDASQAADSATRDSVVVRWNLAALQGVRESQLLSLIHI